MLLYTIWYSTIMVQYHIHMLLYHNFRPKSHKGWEVQSFMAVIALPTTECFHNVMRVTNRKYFSCTRTSKAFYYFSFISLLVWGIGNIQIINFFCAVSWCWQRMIIQNCNTSHKNVHLDHLIRPKKNLLIILSRTTLF